MSEGEILKILEKKVMSYNKKDWNIVYNAYLYAKAGHKGQKRESGEDYIVHPLYVTYILACMHADTDTLCAGVLHDILEDTKTTYNELKEKFNEDVANLVDGVSKITKLDLTDKTAASAENVRRVIVSIKNDARIIFIKLADRLHNMRTLEYKTDVERKHAIALETLEIYVPTAYYIGSYRIKEELENLSFQYLNPDTYNDLKKKLDKIHYENKDMLESMVKDVKRILDKNNIKAKLEIHYKDTYSVYKKMITNNTIENIHDLLCIKVITGNIKNCYLALMFIHSLYPPFSYKFKDYIANPKSNLYQSLHTTVYADNNRLVQFQIRTKEMEIASKYGLTSFWFKHKKISDIQKIVDKKFQFVKSIEQLDSSIADNIEFINLAKRELFGTNIYVRSSKGEVVELPLNATPIDFAYKIHTDIGNYMVAAIVNDEVVPFDYRLKNNDRVRIIIDEKTYVPKDDWINIAVTTNARKKIQDFIKEKEHERNE